MSLTSQFDEIISRRLNEFAEDVYQTMKGEAAGHRASGKLYSGIRKVKTGPYSYFVGVYSSDVPYAYYAEYGNHANGPDGRIHPTNKSALTLKTGNKVIGYAKSVKPSSGTHFVRNTRSKYK